MALRTITSFTNYKTTSKPTYFLYLYDNYTSFDSGSWQTAEFEDEEGIDGEGTIGDTYIVFKGKIKDSKGKLKDAVDAPNPPFDTDQSF